MTLRITKHKVKVAVDRAVYLKIGTTEKCFAYRYGSFMFCEELRASGGHYTSVSVFSA